MKVTCTVSLSKVLRYLSLGVKVPAEFVDEHKKGVQKDEKIKIQRLTNNHKVIAGNMSRKDYISLRRVSAKTSVSSINENRSKS